MGTAYSYSRNTNRKKNDLVLNTSVAIWRIGYVKNTCMSCLSADVDIGVLKKLKTFKTTIIK